MSDGIILKLIVDQIKIDNNISDKTLRKFVSKYVINGWVNETSNSSKISYVLSSMKKPSLTIKKFFEFYTIVGYTSLKFTILMTTDGEETAVETVVDLGMDKSMFGVNLKEIVDAMNVRCDISPARLSSHLSSWAAKNFPEMSTADIEHKAGNIAKSLTGTAITWRRLLDYFSVFEVDELALNIEATGELKTSKVRVIIDLNKRIENDRRIRANQRRVKHRNKQNRKPTRGKRK